MLLPLRRAVTELRHSCRRDLNHATSEPQSGRRSNRSNRHLHHRHAEVHRCAPAIEKARWRTGDLGLNDANVGASWRKNRARDATAFAGPLPRYVTSKAGFEPAFPMVRSIRNLHHQRSLSREMRPTKIEKQNLSRRSQRRTALANPFPVRSAIGVRLAPRSLRQAPRFGRAPSCASPGIRVSRSGFSRRNFEGPCSGK